MAESAVKAVMMDMQTAEDARALSVPDAARQVHPLRSGAGGSLSDWIRRIHGDAEDPLAGVGEPMQRLARIAQARGCTEGLIAGLVAAEGQAQAEVRRLREALAELERDKRFVEGLLARRDHQFAQLQKQWRAKRHATLSHALRRAKGAIGRMFLPGA